MTETTVFRGMTRDELDRQYDQRTLVPQMALLFDDWLQRSTAFATRHGMPHRISYGPDRSQGVDLFAVPDARGLHVHYHGGAWKALESRHAWWLAEPWLKAGYCFAAVDFRLVPVVRLAEQVRDARLALSGVHELMEPGLRLVVSGHSSGAHLAAMAVLAPEAGQPAPQCDHLILASGIYDLKPVRLSGRNDYLRLDHADALSLSPELRLDSASGCPVTLIWSRNELAEFQRQSRSMADTLHRAGMPVDGLTSSAANHFKTWDLITPDLPTPWNRQYPRP
ncbi:MAG: alpha/beta hydrolase [Pararhodobacter sp.]